MNNELKKDYPIFDNNNIVYLDSGATTQKPNCVIDAIAKFYKTHNANPHRGVYQLSEYSTNDLSSSRQTVAKFIGANDEEIVFTKNATEALNLLANSYGLDNVGMGDEIVISILEHHSNLVPWQRVAKQKGANLKYLYIDKNYQIPDSELKKITKKTKIVSILSVSNVVGTIVDVEKITKIAHKFGAKVIVDLSQSIAHMPFDVKESDVDFAVFGGHKMYAPLGVGVLYGKKELLDKMQPQNLGGDMIEYVYEQEATFANSPNKFEGGTQDIASIVGLKKAVEYINSIGYSEIRKIEENLIKYAINTLKNLDFIEIYAPNDVKDISSVISFNVKGVHPHDVASLLNEQNICVRSGNHCAQPLLRFLGLDSTIRISFGVYNTTQDIDKLKEALIKVYDLFKKYLRK